MPIKTFNTRIKNKVDSVDNYTPDSGALIPLKGEILIGYESNNRNTNTDPYMMKVGDGTNNWDSLPCIGPNTFHYSSSSSSISGDTNSITVNIPSDKKVYSTYVFDSSDDTSSLEITFRGGDYMLTEHYLLLVNSSNNMNHYIDRVTIEGIDASNIYLQKDYVSAYDILEMKIAIYPLSDSTYGATVTTKAGIVNGGEL